MHAYIENKIEIRKLKNPYACALKDRAYIQENSLINRAEGNKE